ncbi:MAG: hypothetical protein GYA59_08145 [Chloroflexi bacterium]|nr:hypothetical protein [Chloroflexota bacterium]
MTAADPTQERIYPRSVSIEIVGQDPALVLTSEVPTQMTITLSAPASIWDRLQNEQEPIRAVVDLSGLGAGTYTVPVQVQVSIRPVEVVSYSPQTLTLELEMLASRTLPIRLVQRGELAIGYEAETPQLNQTSATVSGPESLVNQVKEVRAVLDVNAAEQSINRSIALQAIDAKEMVVNGVTVSPEQVAVSLTITQRGGYRNVVVKVVVKGQVASGYRVTNISVFPPAVTVYSSDPKLVDELPGYVETAALELSNAREDLDVFLQLNLPPGVSVVGDQTVEVQVGVEAIEGSLTLADMPVEVVGLGPGLVASTSPERVDVILAGPLPLLDSLTARDVRVLVDMTDETAGTYQRVPKVELTIPELSVESILPGSVEIVIARGTPTPTFVSP